MSLLPISGILLFFLLIVTEIIAIPTDWLSNVHDCSAVRNHFNNRNLTLFYLHPNPRQDNSLRVCSKVTNSCCNDAVERQLFHYGKVSFEKKLRGQIHKLSTNFRKLYHKFHAYFEDLLNDSKRAFHDMFTITYGIIYVQNSYLFTDFFHLLEEYYASGKLNLDEVLEQFFTSLYQRMFEVLNAQYKFDVKYLSCVVDLMKEIRPFGNIAKEFSVKLKHSFMSIRTFSQSLDVGADVSANMLKVNLTEECLKSFLKMQFCSGCSGVLEIKSCSNYCINVMKGCFANFIELNDEWVNYIDGFDKITEKLLTTDNIISVVEPMDVKISEAIMNFQDNGVIVSQRIFNGCGKPNQTRKGRATSSNSNHNRLKLRTKRNNKRRRKPKSNFKMTPEERREALLQAFKQIITETREKVKEFKHFWSHLPYQICNNKNVSEGPSRDIDCWNGTVVDRYLPPIVRDGFKNQRDNPSVIVDVSKQNTVLREQIFFLKSISKKLQHSYNTIDVYWFEEEFDTVSGSGVIDDENTDFEDNWRTIAPPTTLAPTDGTLVTVHSGNGSISSTVAIPETTTILTTTKKDNNSSSSRQTIPDSILEISVLVMFLFYF